VFPNFFLARNSLNRVTLDYARSQRKDSYSNQQRVVASHSPGHERHGFRPGGPARVAAGLSNDRGGGAKTLNSLSGRDEMALLSAVESTQTRLGATVWILARAVNT
jgi:hypothetical protein